MHKLEPRRRQADFVQEVLIEFREHIKADNAQHETVTKFMGATGEFVVASKERFEKLEGLAEQLTGLIQATNLAVVDRLSKVEGAKNNNQVWLAAAVSLGVAVIGGLITHFWK